jgi:hypothetical protein
LNRPEAFLNGRWCEETSGKILWRGKNPKLENSTGEVTLRVDGGRIIELPFWKIWQRSRTRMHLSD